MDPRPAVRTGALITAGATLPLWAPIGLAAVGAYLVVSPAGGRSPLPLPSRALPLAVAAGALLSPWPWRGALSVAALALALWVLQRVQRGIARGDRLAFLSGAVTATVANLGVAAGQLGLDHRARAAGLTFHPNMAGAVAVAVLFFALGGVVAGGRRERRWAFVGAAAALPLLLASGSRGAFVSALVGTLAMLVGGAAARSRRAVTAALAVVAALMLVAAVALIAPSSVRLSSADESSALGGRPLLWGVGLTLAAERPLVGYGTDPWPSLARTVEPALRSTAIATVHNGFLYVLLVGGVVALAAVLAWSARLGWRLLARARGGHVAAAAALGLWLAFLTNNLSETLLPRTALTLWVWWALALTSAPDAPQGAGATGSGPPDRGPAGAAPAAGGTPARRRSGGDGATS